MKGDIYVTKKCKSVSCFVWKKIAQRYQIACSLVFFAALAHTSVAQISGVVYRDFNEDGVRSFTVATPSEGEIGVGGVIVNVYNNAGLAGTTITGSAITTAGSYTVTVSGVGPYRVDFIGLPTGYYNGLRGTASGTSVQFVASSPATNINLGINYPSDYCQASPGFFVPCYVNGNPLGTGNSATQGVLISLPYNSVGDSPAESAIAINSQVGTVYGIAYQREAKSVFSSAFVKRHSGLGTGGAGAIYMTRPGSGTTTLFTSLPTAATAISAASLSGNTVVGTNAARGLPAATTTQNHDPVTFDQVGKAGLGDLEMSEDGTQLYVVNLGDRRLYQIPIINPTSINPTAGTPTSFSLPAVTQTAGSVFRPFALKYYRGLVYIGGVTTNEAVSTTVNSGLGSTGGSTPLITRDTTGMKAIVYEFNPVDNTFTPVLNFPLTYKKGASDNDQTGVSRADRWFPWTNVEPATGTLPNRYARNDGGNTSYPQPILAGIEFDVDGSMILSIRDRFGDQYGNSNYTTSTTDNTTTVRAIAPGDILRAGKCDPARNQWTIESNARICNGVATLGANTAQGPGGGEYYYGDAIAAGNGTIPYHVEMSEGGLALLPGRGEVASIVLDPTISVDAGGIRRFKNSDGSGSPATSVQIYKSGDVSTYGKANGLGDLEIGCDLPPIQIGNRVWRDVNNNGIQDPGEPGLAGIQVILRGPGSTTIATATTDINGEYYFSSAVATNTANSISNLTLTAGGSYTLSFPTSVSAFNISTFPSAATGTNANSIDSDPNAAGTIAFILGNAGENNFTYDAGYACAPLALTLTSMTICAGRTVSLTATAGFSSYTFSTGLTQVGTTNQATGAAAGSYSVTAINSAGCSNTATGSITVNPNPVVTLSSATICAGQSATLIAVAGYTNYSFSAGLTSMPGQPNIATGTVGGAYSVTATSSASCSGSATGNITVNPKPTAVITVIRTTICQGESATLTASGGATYVWSTREQSASIVVATSGVYSVTVNTVNGCSDIASTTITVNPAPVLTVTSATVCPGQSATLTVGGCEGGKIVWSKAETTASILVSPSITTTYSATCTVATGCSSTISTMVIVNKIPSYTAVPHAVTASCTGPVANNNARIDLTTLQNTDRADIVAGSSYGTGPVYGAPTNITVTAGAVSFANLPNPGTSQPYTIRLFSAGTCHTDVTVIVEPAICNCPLSKCVPFLIQQNRTGRMALR